MDNKEIDIINILLEHNDWISSDKILAQTDYSLRTLRNLVRSINSKKNYILSSNKGYSINFNYKEDLLVLLQNNPHNSIIENPRNEIMKSRIQYIIRELLISGNTLDYFDLADKLYISESTLNSDLTILRRKIALYNLNLSKKKNKLYLIGNEKDIRKLLSDSVYFEVQDGLLNMNVLQQVFPDYQIHNMRSCLLNIIFKHHLFINDFGMINLVLHLCVTLNRIKKSQILEENEKATVITSENPEIIYSIANEIVYILSHEYSIRFNEHEVNNLVLLLEVNVRTFNSDTVTLSSLENYVPNSTIDFVYEIVRKVYEVYRIELNNPEFIVRFSLHLNSLLKYRYSYKNPLYENIKSSFPLLFEIAVYITNLVNIRFSLKLNSHDISFIVLHLGLALEDITHKRIPTILTVPNYHNLREILYSNLTRRYGNNLNITLADDELVDFDNYPLIISTTPLSVFPKESQVVVISPFLNYNDTQIIDKKIKFIENTKNNANKELIKTMDESHFMILQDSLSIDKIINSLCEKLYVTGYVNDDFVNDVHYREALSSTSYSNIAIPHSLMMNSLKSAISVCIIPNFIQWGSNNVNIVILLAITHNDKQKFKDLFMNLINIFTSESWNKFVPSIRDYNDFATFVENYSQK